VCTGTERRQSGRGRVGNGTSGASPASGLLVVPPPLPPPPPPPGVSPMAGAYTRFHFRST